ncbi:DUF262 domain-containing protein [Alkalibacillus haloalkaliphilus]|uniref:DUF262 domain-containing protein n=1 Tax=Alkalibacillus haloalkaliphilus TaxID=94136 RepID=UPI002935D2E2|nr:DUF262 domain-containing HNH endonuclease family protein [Alkalibacillus haloalkaliphilus]MDV2581408.1 DUF262 domain-containing HNH endonuclease family protein [Alkalibacillus haloalkaliphilus]
MTSIDSKIQTVGDLLMESEYTYYIPDYQRSFVWGREQARDLISDFIIDTDEFSTKTEDLEGYLLGNIVVIRHDDVKEFEVVDGQQRMTALSLLLICLYKRMHSIAKNQDSNPHLFMKYSGLANSLFTGFQKPIDDDYYMNRIHHHASILFGETYSKILQEKDYHDSEESKADSNIIAVFEELSDSVDELTDQQIINFSNYLKKKVSVIKTIAPNEAKAFQLFEILNDRGVKLTQADLIKNFLLRKVNELDINDLEYEKFSKNWSDFLENLIQNKRSYINENQFLKHYLLGKYGVHKKVEQLYTFFSKELRNLTLDQYINLSEDLKNSAKIYKNIFYKNHAVFVDDKDKLEFFVNVIDIKQLYALLIPFYNANDEVREEVLDLAIKFGAAVIFSFTQTNFIEKELPGIISAYLKDKEKDEKQAYNNFKKKIKTITKDKAEEAFQTIRIRRFEKGSSSKPIGKAEKLLKFIEYYSTDNEIAIKEKYKKDNITVEHILAKELPAEYYEEHGFESKSDFRNYLNRIGNLTLLLGSPNTAASNKTPGEKADHFSQSEFAITNRITGEIEYAVKSGKQRNNIDLINESYGTYISDSVSFNKEAIEKRSEETAKIVRNLLIS